MKQKRPVAGKKYARSAILFIVIELSFVAWWLIAFEREPQILGLQSKVSSWGAGLDNPFGRAGAAPAAKVNAQEASSPFALLQLEQTSLAGTQLDGLWAADAQGQLRKDFALRQRLDYFLTLLGEQPLDQVRALVQQKARAELPEPALSQLMQIWDRYVQLQQHAFKTTVDLRQPSGWSAALQERQTVRRSVLGADVAYAFYGQEERELQGMLARVNSSGGSAPHAPHEPHEPSAPQMAALPDASQREAQLQQQWKDWEQRIETARAQVQRLQAAPELSPVQRQSAVQQVLMSQFAEGSERLRAASLLGL